jgi:hypothetical protein
VDSTWVIALIGAAAGVGGAAVGGGALLWANRLEAADRREGEHRAALVGLWAAANSLGMLYASVGDTLPKRSDWFSRARYGIQMSGYARMFVERLLDASDRLWKATGNLRTVAMAEELDVLNEIESVFGGWQIGDPLPDGWSPAIQRLRLVLEAQGVSPMPGPASDA